MLKLEKGRHLSNVELLKMYLYCCAKIVVVSRYNNVIKDPIGLIAAVSQPVVQSCRFHISDAKQTCTGNFF